MPRTSKPLPWVILPNCPQSYWSNDRKISTRTACSTLLLLTVSGCYTTHELASANTDQCVQTPLKGSPILAGTRVTLAQYFGRSDTQRWVIGKNQISGVADMVLDVQDGTGVEGAPVIVMPCNGSSHQRWRVTSEGQVGLGGKCLDVPGGDIAQSAPLILAVCSGASSQQWSLR